MKLILFDRINTALEMKLQVAPVVESMSWGEGGPQEAKASLQATDILVWQLAEILRCPAEVWDTGERVWWGFVKSVQIVTTNGLRITLSLEKMANRVRVEYSLLTAGTDYAGESTLTSWVSDADSVAVYGTKELQLRMSQEATAEQATAYANRALGEYAWPLADRDLGNVGKKTVASGVITMAGWWETLAWKSYSEDAGKESYEDIGTGLQAFGDATARSIVLQRIQLGSSRGWSADQIALRVKKEGSPVDNLSVSLKTDAGVVLATATLAGASVPENLNWVTLTLSTRVNLALSTTYQITVTRSGAIDAVNYYKIDANESLGYTRGALQIYNGSTWVSRSPDADMLFQVLGVLETTQQIADIVTDCGQFLVGSSILDASGVYSTPFRDGSNDGLRLIRELLKSGTSNGRRLRALVRDDYYVEIDEEPAAGVEDWKMLADGTILDQYNGLVKYPPYQTWIQFSNLIPITADTSLVADPTRAFIEQATWSKGAARFRLRGMGMGQS